MSDSHFAPAALAGVEVRHAALHLQVARQWPAAVGDPRQVGSRLCAFLSRARRLLFFALTMNRDPYACGPNQLMDTPMNLTLLNGPAAEPLALDDVKAHLRLDGDDEDTLLGSLVTTSRLHVETALGLALMTQTWRWQADCWPTTGVVELMTRPVRSVDRVAVRGADGTQTIVDAAGYLVDAASGRVAAQTAGFPQPGAKLGGIEIDFTAGYGDTASDVPEPIRQALRLLVAHWYEVRNPVHIGSFAARVPDTVSELLMPYKARRL